MDFRRRIAGTVLGLAALVVAAGCGPKNIASIKSRSAKYEAKTVTITARVVDTRDIPLTDNDYYKITDDSAELWVLTTRGVPLKTFQYRIEGRYERPLGSVAGMLLGGYIIRETKREEIRRQ